MHQLILLLNLGTFAVCQGWNEISYFHLEQSYQNVIKLDSQKRIEFVYKATAMQSLNLAVVGFPIPYQDRRVNSNGSESSIALTLNSKDLFRQNSKHGAYSVNATLTAGSTHSLMVPMIVIYEDPLKDLKVFVPESPVFTHDNLTAHVSFSSGSNVIVEWWLSDGKHVCFDHIPHGAMSYSFNFKFVSTGNQNLVIVASNGVSTEIKHLYFYIFPRELKVTFVASKTDIKENEDVVFFRKENATFRNNTVTITADFGDNSSRSEMQFQLAMAIMFHHVYKSTGKFVFQYNVTYLSPHNLTVKNSFEISVSKRLQTTTVVTSKMTTDLTTIHYPKTPIHFIHNETSQKSQAQTASETLQSESDKFTVDGNSVRPANDTGQTVTPPSLPNSTMDRSTISDSNALGVYTLLAKPSREVIYCPPGKFTINVRLNQLNVSQNEYAKTPSNISCQLDQEFSSQLVLLSATKTNYISGNIPVTKYKKESIAINLYCTDRYQNTFPQPIFVKLEDNPCFDVETYINYMNSNRHIRAYTGSSITISSKVRVKCICGTTYSWKISKLASDSNTTVTVYDNTSFFDHIDLCALVNGACKVSGTYEVSVIVSLQQCRIPYLDTMVKENWTVQVVSPTPMAFISGGYRRLVYINARETTVEGTARYHTGNNLTYHWHWHSNMKDEYLLNSTVSSDKQSLNITNLLRNLPSNEKYVDLVLTITSGSLTSTFRQVLGINHNKTMLKKEPHVKCVSNCLDKLALSKKLELTCIDCSADFGAFVFSSSDRFKISGDTATLDVGDNPNMTMTVGLWNEAGAHHFSIMNFYRNVRPYNGTCSMNSNKGFELYDSFFVICENWQDEGQELPGQSSSGIDYPLYYRVLLPAIDTIQNPLILYEGWESQSDMFRLPRGRKENGYIHSVLVEVVDLYGDAQTVSLNITVVPANITQDFYSTMNDFIDRSHVTDNSVQASMLSITNVMREARSVLLSSNCNSSETSSNINHFIETSKNAEQVNSKVTGMLLKEVKDKHNYDYKQFLKYLSVIGSSSSLICTSDEQSIVNMIESSMALTSNAEVVVSKEVKWDNEDKRRAKSAIRNGTLDVIDHLLQPYTPEALVSQQNFFDSLRESDCGQIGGICDKIEVLENKELARQSTQREVQQKSFPLIVKTIDDFSRFLFEDIKSYNQVHHVLSDNLAMTVRRVKSDDIKHLNTNLNGTKMALIGCQNGNRKNYTLEASKLRIGTLPMGKNLTVLSTDITITSLDAQCMVKSQHSIPYHAQPSIHPFHPVRTGQQNSYKVMVPNHIRQNDALVVYLTMDWKAESDHVYVAYVGESEHTNNHNYLIKKTLRTEDVTQFGYRLFIRLNWLTIDHVYILLSEEKQELKNTNHGIGRKKRSHRDPNYNRGKYSAAFLNMTPLKNVIQQPTKAFIATSLTSPAPRTPSHTSHRKKRLLPTSTTLVTRHTHTVKQGNNLTLKMTTVFTGCRSLDESRNSWDANDCKVLEDSTVNFTICTCRHHKRSILTTTFFVAPNSIPFTSPFLHFDPENAAIYGTIICLICIYVIVVIILRREDKKDQVKWTTYFLCDSDRGDSYLYLISVYTGFRRGAGTKSTVNFILSGEYEDTGVRILSDGVRQGFDTGSVRRFFMGTRYPLGDLSYLRIWHNNDGHIGQQSWYLKKVVVDDLSGRQSYIFTCERWLSSHCGDGKVDRVVPAYRYDINSSFNSKFTEHAQYNITEDHIWLSLFLRPQRSNFTRVQRATCALCLLLLTMIANAMFYGQPRDSVHADLIQMGGIRLSFSDIYISTVGVAVTTPIILLLSFLFRKTRRKTSNWKEDTYSKSSVKDSVIRHENDAIPCDQFYTTQKLSLPHWVRYLAWIALMATVIFSIYVMIAYSMEWGKVRSEKWLVSFTLSFIQSVLVVDPVKVFLLAVLFAAVFKTKNQCKVEADIDQIKKVSSTFDNLSESRILSSMRMEMLHKDEPPTEEVLRTSKLRRMQEIHAQKVFVELVLFGVYAFVIYAISYIGRDQRAFTLKNHLENTFITKCNPSLNMVNTSSDYLDWLSRVFVPNFFPYDDCRGHLKEYAYISDCANIRLGPPRLRQIRVRSEACATPIVPDLGFCYPSYDTKYEDRASYCPGWEESKTNCSINTGKYFSNLSVWSHIDAEQLQAVGTNGEYNAYSGGGYVLTFPSTHLYAEEMVSQMPNSNWLDRGTRAVFLEFTLYNPNVNLFTYVLILTEFPETGSVFRWVNIHAFRPYDFVGSTGTLSIFCYLVFIIILVISTFKTLRDLKNTRCAFFKQPWNVIDLMCNLLSYATIALYVLRTISTKAVMDDFLENLAKNKFTYFQRVVILNFTVENFLAILVFVATIRILKILGYNKRLTEIISVITNAMWDLAGFGVVFAVVFMAYVLYGFLLFGRSLEGYKSVFLAFGTLTNTLIGKNKLDTSVRSVPGIAQLYYFTYNFVVLWTVMTMFAAILNKSIEEVRNQMKRQPKVYGVFDMFTDSVRSLFGGAFMRSKGKPQSSKGLTKPPINAELKFNAKNVLELVRDILKKHVVNMTEPAAAKSRQDFREKEKMKGSSKASPLKTDDKNRHKYKLDDDSNLMIGTLRRRRMSVSRAGTLRDIDLVIKDINKFY